MEWYIFCSGLMFIANVVMFITMRATLRRRNQAESESYLWMRRWEIEREARRRAEAGQWREERP